MVRVAEDALEVVMKTLNTDHHKPFIRGAYRRAARVILTTGLRADGVCKAFESAIIRAATSGQTIQANVNMAVKDKKHMAPVAKFVAEQMKKEVSKTAQQSC